MPRLVVVDRQEIARIGIRTILSIEEDLEVVGEAEDLQEALDICHHVQPDVVLTECRMQEITYLDAIGEIKQCFPEVGVLILAMHQNPYYMWEALKSGILGYVSKDEPPHELRSAVRKVLDGEIALGQSLATELLQRLAADTHNGSAKTLPDTKSASTPSKSLTPREVEVLRSLGLGQTNRKIARNLTISEGTVKNHVQRIKVKLEAADRTQAVVRGFELGIIRLAGGKGPGLVVQVA